MPESAKLKAAYRNSFVLAEEPMVAVIEDVVSADEMEHIRRLASGKIQRAKVSLENENKITKGRTGGNCWLRYAEDPVVKRVGQRIADQVGIPLSHAEAMQVIHYGPTQQYKPHYDAYDLATAKGQRCCRLGGQRLLTGLVYLNEVEEGGATAFPKLGLEVDAKPGRMVLFHNVGEDIKTAHPDSLHAGTPVVKGEKWAFNIWFHARPMTETQDFSAVAAAQPTPASPVAVEAPVRLVTNRASRLWQQALKQIADDTGNVQTNTCICYWDTYGNSHPDHNLQDSGSRIISLIDRRLGNQLANKRSLARLLSENKLHDVAPASFESTEAALANSKKGTTWFVKRPYRMKGKRTYRISHEELASLQLPKDHILQREVDNLVFDEGRRFTARIYTLLWNQSLYLFHTQVTVTSEAPAKGESTDYSAQKRHHGPEVEDSAITIMPGQREPEFVKRFPQLKRLTTRLLPVLSESLRATSKDDYLLLAIDVLLCTDGTVKLVKINSAPNFVHTLAVNEEVNIPFFEACMRTMLGFTDDRLELIGE